MMSPTRIAALVLRQYYLMGGSVARLLNLVVWVGVDIVLWGFITRYLGNAVTGLAFVPMLLGAILLWDFLIRVSHGLAIAFFEDVWTRNFLNIFASPLSVGEYITSLVVSSIATSTIGVVFMMVLASVAFGLSFAVYGIMIAQFMFILFLTGIALGVLGAAIVLRLGPSAEWLVWPIPAVISPFVCVFYPQASLPEWMQAVSKILPPSYVFESMRTVIAGGAVDMGMLAAGLALAAFYLLLACMLFCRIFKRAIATGLIARYSAETVS